jgi:hypothetical protein
MTGERDDLWFETFSVMERQYVLLEAAYDMTSRSTERRAATEDAVAQVHDLLERSSRNLRISMICLLACPPAGLARLFP